MTKERNNRREQERLHLMIARASGELYDDAIGDPRRYKRKRRCSARGFGCGWRWAHKPDVSELVRRAQAGDVRARDRVIAAHMTQVRAEAERLLRGNSDRRAGAIDDLLQAGVCGGPTCKGTGGLMRAIETWDHAGGSNFATWARAWIVDAMRDELGVITGTSLAPGRRGRNMRAYIRRRAAKLEALLGRAPTALEVQAEIPESAGKSHELWAIEAALLPLPQRQAGAPGTQDDMPEVSSELPPPDAALDDRRNYERLKALIASDFVSAEERELLRICYGFDDAARRAGASAAEAARRLGVNRSTALRKLRCVLERLREALEAPSEAPRQAIKTP